MIFWVTTGKVRKIISLDARFYIYLRLNKPAANRIDERQNRCMNKTGG